ncbi:hypothetical protein N7476_009339 [Penicillium atrosanguineum]|uniref:Uncharacterized protein n=1 Tax=Penicillium atrosanguineum TaxID=1132637 RepID=A0A9W9PN62_9EURO|nr:hypothetical protein N7476_009339 [Penicillium atrosanguineum]
MADKVPKNIRPLNRYITTHNNSGQAIFSSAISEVMPVQRIPDSADFSLAYTSDHFPAQLNNDSDITEYNNYLSSPPGITISTGTVCRIVDIQPHATSPMHRTVSLDYGVVLEGEIELRGTNHAWKNVTPDAIVDGVAVPQWARMLYVLSPSEEIEIEGKKLKEVVDGIGVRAST